MRWLLNFVYLCTIVAASPWLAYTSWRTGKYRQGWRAKFLGDVPPRTGSRPCVWFHAVSVGEVNLLDGVIAELVKRRPDVEFVISTTTQTGYSLARRKYSNHSVCYCPLDFSWAVDKTLSRIRPSLLVLVELELWPNLISAARRENVPVVVINGRLSEASYRGYRRIRPLIGRGLRQLTTVAAQNQEYADRFVSLGAHPADVSVTGSIKFDNANADRDNSQTTALRDLVGIRPGDTVLLAGSTQNPEESLALAAFEELCQQHSNLRLIVVPRHPERFDEVHQLLSKSRYRYLRRSTSFAATSSQDTSSQDTPHSTPTHSTPSHSTPTAEDRSNSNCPMYPLPGGGEGRVRGKKNVSYCLGGPDSDWRILLVDTIGELGAWWGLADIAFVGGSMGDRGGQNMIEPAAYGAAVCFGPKTKNFRDVVSMLLNEEAAYVVQDGNDLAAFLKKCLTDTTFARQAGSRARSLVSKQRGATEMTVDILESQLPKTRSKHQCGSQRSASVLR